MEVYVPLLLFDTVVYAWSPEVLFGFGVSEDGVARCFHDFASCCNVLLQASTLSTVTMHSRHALSACNVTMHRQHAL